MTFIKISLIALLCIGSALAGGHPNKHGPSGKNQVDIKNLGWKDKFFLHLLTKLSPSTFKDVPADILAEISAYPNYSPTTDNFFVDARQLFIQSKKLTENVNLPEFDWGHHFDFCFWVICLDFEVNFSTGGTQFIGTDTIKSTTNITPTSIENTFEIGHFNWSSPGFLINVTNYNSETIHLSGNSFATFSNIILGFKCDYHFVPEVGIQLENLRIYFNAGQVRAWLWDITIWDFAGDLIRTYYPEKYNYEEDMMDYWTKVKKDYSKGLQYSLNCFLSNGRSDPEGCFKDTGNLDLDPEYYRLLNMEFLQSLGLGELL